MRGAGSRRLDDDVGGAVEWGELDRRGRGGCGASSARSAIIGHGARGVVEERGELGGEVLGGEVVLEELGDDAAAGDEVGHGDGQIAGGVGHVGDLVGIADEALGDGEGQGGDTVDDDERVSDGGGQDGGGTAGDDGGAGVMEGFAGVGDKS